MKYTLTRLTLVKLCFSVDIEHPQHSVSRHAHFRPACGATMRRKSVSREKTTTSATSLQALLSLAGMDLIMTIITQQHALAEHTSTYIATTNVTHNQRQTQITSNNTHTHNHTHSNT